MTLAGQSSALAFSSGSTGYDISYVQCGQSYPTGAFGIVGVDTGWPFISSVHPGNPCLASEFAHQAGSGLYVNTGYDPSYTDASHTTSGCALESANVFGTSAQKAAWAAGCSEAAKDLDYVASQGVAGSSGWWLDVETSNSWCGQPGTNCIDLTLNQYAIQGLVDTLAANSTAPIGIYSTPAQWSSIVGNAVVTGLTADWVATSARSARRAAAYCSSTYGFSGDRVALVQYLTSSVDRDLAC
jgi:hypothetical protein